jgi:hypothetical protein
VCTATGWTYEYLLWKISWVNLQMMIVDAPRYDSSKDNTIEEPEDVSEIERILNL